jgi:MFS family permease
VLIAVAGVVLAISLAAVATVLSAAAPDARQGKVMGNNAALLVLGEVVGVSGGAFIAGIRTWLPLLVLAGLAIVACVLIGVPKSVTPLEVLEPESAPRAGTWS